jgi:hypothetical protein
VWIAGHGWQSFDPTASVPLANPAPGATALRDVAHALGRIPPLPTASIVLAALIVVAFMRWRRIRARTWLDRILREAERTGRRAGRPRLVHESLTQYASALDELVSPDESNWRDIAVAVERYAYGGEQFSVTEQDLLVTSARDLRIGRRQSIVAR